MKETFIKKIFAAAAGAVIAVCSLNSISVKAAETPTVSIQMKGSFEAGQEVELDINISNVEAFYAGSVELKLDPSIVQLLDIDKGSFITSESINILQAYKDVSAGEGRVRYGFTCTGQIKGFSGSGTFARIKAKVLKKGSISIKNIPRTKELSKDNNIILQIVDGTGTPVEMNYGFTSFEYNAEGNQTSTGGSTSTNTTSSGTANNANTNNTNTTNSSTSHLKSEDISKPGFTKTQQTLKKESDKNSSTQKGVVPLVFAAGTLGLAVIAGTLYFLLLKRKKAKLQVKL